MESGCKPQGPGTQVHLESLKVRQGHPASPKASQSHSGHVRSLSTIQEHPVLPRVTWGQPGSPRVTQRVLIKPSCPLYLLSVWSSGKGQTGLHPRGVVRACGLGSGMSNIVSNSNMASSWTSELGQPQRPVWKDGQQELAGGRGGWGAPGGPSEGRSPGRPQKPSFLEGALTPHVGGRRWPAGGGLRSQPAALRPQAREE